MWEPFSRPARRAIVRSQEVAQMFGAHFIGTEHIMFALAEGDDPVGRALAQSVDRETMRQRLGTVSSAPTVEMVFTTRAKQCIELAFENARRLNHNYIGTAHIALGILSSVDPPPLLPGKDVRALRAALDLAATHEGDPAADAAWKLSEGDAADPAATAITSTLEYFPHLGKVGTRVTVTVAEPGASEQTWTWIRQQEGRS